MSNTKTKLMTKETPCSHVSFIGDFPDSPLSIELVSAFKYLGVKFNSKPYRLFSDHHESIIQKCERYTANILSLSRNGPDRSFPALTLWKSVAIPSILYGIESIPLPQYILQKIETYQNRICKFALQTPPSSASIQTTIDAGLIPIRFHVCQRVLQYAQKLMKHPSHNLAATCFSQAMNKNSKYGDYVISQLQLLPSFPYFPANLSEAIKIAVRTHCQQVIPAYPTCMALVTPKVSKIGVPKSWLNDSPLSATFACFRSMNCGLCNRYPTVSGFSSKDCLFCESNGILAPNNEVHLVDECSHFDMVRSQTILSHLILARKSRVPPISSLSIYNSILDDKKNSRKLRPYSNY